jgi:uncharacterized protein with NAD-binding domain and iron-sulfur cluster
MNRADCIKVAVIGGGCASITAAFELSRPEHQGKYDITVYQLGWRLGGKAASGRGPADRIEEHGLHVWLGFYENAFRLLRECYAELGRDPSTCPIAEWRNAFCTDHEIGMADKSSRGTWLTWTAHFPPADGLPGDPLTTHNPFALGSYFSRAAVLLQALLFDVKTRGGARTEDTKPSEMPDQSTESVTAGIERLLQYGSVMTTAGLLEALTLLQVLFKTLPKLPDTILTPFIENVAEAVRRQLENIIVDDDEARCRWEIIDLVIAIFVGAARFGLLFHPNGLDAINDYDCREWLRMNGASERSLDSAFMRGLYDLALAYENGDRKRPALAAGQGLRGSLRMFFTYRGAMFWKMRAGMGDVVFAPFYEVLKRRGVKFEFFHRLQNVKLSSPKGRASEDSPPYVEALEFDVQAKVRGRGEYRPLRNVQGLPCWPSQPDYRQLVDGSRMQRAAVDFESHWNRRRVGRKKLRVSRDFDFVVLGISVAAIPYVCKDIIARDPKWRDMVTHVKTVATQAFQIWLYDEMPQLGWMTPPVTLSAFTEPFDTWADMRQCASQESWLEHPGAMAYFCGVLADPSQGPIPTSLRYPTQRHEEVRRNAIDFLNQQVHHLWSNARGPKGTFRWELLMDANKRPGRLPRGESDERRFSSQYWRANVNPTDRYVLALPGSLKYRISPLDSTYDNLTIAGDWTDCGFNEGCVEAAVMSGRLAAHALSKSPPLEEIIGYDHP